MWGRNYGNQSSGDINVNTTIRMSFCELSQLKIGAWNNQISVQIRPSVGTNEKGFREYDQKRKGQTSITQDNANTLLTGIKEYLLPAFEKIKVGDAELKDFRSKPEDETEPVSVSISMGGGENKNALALQIELDDNGKPCFFMHMYLMLRNNNTVDPMNTFDYKFNQKEFAKNFNPNSGDTQVIVVESDFNNFVTLLENQINLLPLAQHGTKYDNAVNAKYRQANNNNNNASGYQQNNNGGGNSSYNAPSSNYSTSNSDGDFLPFN